MTDASPWSYLLLAVVGFVASVVNIVAAGGSFLTLPVLILLGAPSVEANGTNRLGVIAQNASGVWGFHRHRVLDWPWALKATVPTVAGALLGAWLALDVDDKISGILFNPAHKSSGNFKAFILHLFSWQHLLWLV